MFHHHPELKTTKDMFKKCYLLLVLAAALACNASPHKQAVMKKTGPNDLQPDEQQSVVMQQVAGLIGNYNYKKVDLNDSISAIIYTDYLKKIDGNHNYFTAGDLQGFEQYKTVLDDDIKNGDLSHVFYMFNVFQKRYNEYVNYSIAQLSQPFDFTKNETFTYDREKLPYAASENDLHKQWTQRVKYDLLNLMLTGKTLEANKETLKKRYSNILSQSNKLNSQDVFQIFMESFTGAIDPHTSYFIPSEAAAFNIDISRSLEGIGATLQSQNEYVTITSIVPGGPADKSKQLAVDERIIGVAQGKTGEMQDIVGWRIENAIALIRGTKGTIVRLQLLPKGTGATGKPRVIELVREKIILKDISAKKEIRTYNENGKIVKIGIINVPAFYLDFADYKAGNPNYKSTTRDVRLILDTLKREGVDGVVLDLRQNGGGSLTEATELTGLFIKTGPVVQVRDPRNSIELEKDDDPAVAYAGPLAVLVDRFSASASEIFSGAIQDYGRGLIIGTQTYGKGSVQRIIDLDEVISPTLKERLLKLTGKSTTVSTGSQNRFGQLNLTIGKFYRISGGSTQHKGVLPDIQFPSVIPLDKYGEDTEPSAMPYDVIPKTDYTKVGDFTAVLPQLKKLHEQRMSSSDSFKYLMQDIAEMKARDAETSVTLNEAELKLKRDADEKKAFEQINLRRVALGFPALKKGDAKPKNEDLDFLKREAGQILTDYLTLDNKVSTTIK